MSMRRPRVRRLDGSCGIGSSRDIDDEIDLRLPEIKKRERSFEYQLRDQLKPIAFIKCKPTIEGFPDRLAIGLGAMMLVELKREGEDLSDIQRLVHRDLRKQGIDVLVIQGPDARKAANLIRAELRRRAR